MNAMIDTALPTRGNKQRSTPGCVNVAPCGQQAKEFVMGNNDKKIITISREFGSGGRLIGKRLA